MFVADLHIHSKFSRATSNDMDCDTIASSARLKGIDLVGTGDFTHPEWLKDLKRRIKPCEYGLYRHKDVLFMLTAEVNNIYSRGDKTRRVHNILIAPSFVVVEKINKMFAGFGDLSSDGRPILALDCEEMAKRLFDIDDDIMIIPAHVWTPHFSLYGSVSGFDSIEECFGKYAPKILAVETGLSSDPPMNWRVSALDKVCLVSNSDAHSPMKLGREANVFREKLKYKELMDVLRTKDPDRFLYTIEFFPEEGKYHYDGHRQCGVRLKPAETKKLGGKCPKCGKKITVGVLNRVEKLADRKEGARPDRRPGYKSLVPLAEIIALAMGVGRDTMTVKREYAKIVPAAGRELEVLLDLPEEAMFSMFPEAIARGIMNVREKEIDITPGFDGEYGKVDVFARRGARKEKQMDLFL